MDIVAVATVAMDIIYQVDKLPKEDGFAVILKTTMVDGGSGANAIVQAAKMGAKCGFIAKLGDDDIGMKFRKGLVRENIDTSRLQILKGGTSIHTLIIVGEEGKKFILVNMGDAFTDLKEEEIDLDYIKQAKVFYTDLIPYKPAAYALKFAKENGLKTVFNLQVGLDTMKGFGVGREDLLNILPYVDVFSLNKDTFLELTGKENLDDGFEEIQKHFDGLPLVTLGSQGSTTVYQGQRITVPVYEVKVVDTTGAGDSYIGTFITAHFIKGMDVEEAMKFASIAAALTCTKIGARSSPTYAEVEKIAREWAL